MLSRSWPLCEERGAVFPVTPNAVSHAWERLKTWAGGSSSYLIITGSARFAVAIQFEGCDEKIIKLPAQYNRQKASILVTDARASVQGCVRLVHCRDAASH